MPMIEDAGISQSRSGDRSYGGIGLVGASVIAIWSSLLHEDVVVAGVDQDQSRGCR